jgi:hypothetical protein
LLDLIRIDVVKSGTRAVEYPAKRAALLTPDSKADVNPSIFE